MKKFFKGLSKKTKSGDGGKSPSLSRQSFPGAIASNSFGYDIKEKDLAKLHKAAWNGDINKVRQLAKKDPSPLDKENRTPLHLACSQGHEDVVIELLEWKAKTNLGDNESRTPLHRAVEGQHISVVKVLLDYQSDPNVSDTLGDTCLHYAVREGCIEIGAMLVQAGADVTATNKESESVLHAAVSSKHDESVMLLLQKNANVNALDKNLRTPLMLACYHGSINIVRALLQYNADSALKDIRGWTADDVAVMQAHHSCSQLITDHTVKLNTIKRQQSSNVSTPRSGAGSVFGSAPNTPRDEIPASEASIQLGIPAVDKGDADDSDDDPTSRASVINEYDSWGDDTDISIADDRKHKKPTLSSFTGQPIADKPTAPLNVKKLAAKQDSNQSQASSEITWSPDNSPTTPKKEIPQISLGTARIKRNSVQSDDTWSPDNSPASQRKNARVSFKRDDELSEVHDISIAGSSENEAEEHLKLEDDSAPGYLPSSTVFGLQTETAKKKADLMAELGISDTEDVSEADISEGGGGDGEWNSSIEQQHARHGILKNWKADNVEESDYHGDQERNVTANNQLYTVAEEPDIYGSPYADFTTQAPLKQAKPLEHIDWDSSEAMEDDLSNSLQGFDNLLHDNGEKQTTVAKVEAVNHSLMSPLVEDDEEEDWDSEDEIVSQQSNTPKNLSPVNLSPRHESSTKVSHDERDNITSGHVSSSSKVTCHEVMGGMLGNDDDDDEEEEEESISEWEIERIKSKMKKEETEVAAELARRGFPVPADHHHDNQVVDIDDDEHAALDGLLEVENTRQLEWERLNKEKIDNIVLEAQYELEKEDKEEDSIHSESKQTLVEKDLNTNQTTNEQSIQEERFMETSTAFRGDDISHVTTYEAREGTKHREELNHIQTILGTNHSPPLPISTQLSAPDVENNHKMDLVTDGNSFFDDDDSIISDNFVLESPGVDRAELMLTAPYLGDLSQSQKLYTPSVDDDGLSCTDTEDLIGGEFIMPPVLTQDFSDSTLASGDPNSVIKLQEALREQKRVLDRERYQLALLQNKHRCLTKDKADCDRKLDSLAQGRSLLEQHKLEMDARTRSLEYNLTEESEKRRNAELLLKKTREQLERKENQYTAEIEGKQGAELALRNMNMELRTANVTIKQLEEQKADLDRLLSHEKNARQIQDQITHEHHRAQLKLQEATRNIDSDRTDVIQRLETTEENRRSAEGSIEKYKAEIYAVKMEMDRIQARRNDEQALALADSDALSAKIDDLKYEVKLNEEALSQATMQYNVQISQLRTENAMSQSSLERERSTREKLEAELESCKNRLAAATTELNKSQSTRSELERLIQKEKEEWNKYSERKEYEGRSLKDANQSLQQRVNNAESRLVSMENELHQSNSSLIKTSEQLNQLQRDYDHKCVQFENISASHYQEKEKSTKLSLKNETSQERLTSLQHELVTMKQHVEVSQRALDDRNGAQLHSKLSEMMDSLKSDSNKNRETMEDKNFSLTENLTKLNEELRNSENRRLTAEMDLKKLNDTHNETVRKLTEAQCNLKVTEEIKQRLEQDKAKIQSALDKVTDKYQAANEKNIELGVHLSGYNDLPTTSAKSNMMDMTGNLHRLEVENTKLESELKYERQKVDMLNKELEDSIKVRDSLEALCSNLKTTNTHLTGKLGEEVITKSHMAREAEASRDLWESEVVTKNKLGMKIAQGKRRMDDLNTQFDEERSNTQRIREMKKQVEDNLHETEAKLRAEVEKNHHLQGEIGQLRTYLKLAMFRLNVCNKIIAARSD